MSLINKTAVIISILFSYAVYGDTSDELTLKAYNAIYNNALTSVKGECLNFDIDETRANYYFISVKENHSKAECPGDDSVSAKIFDIKIDKGTGLIYTNAGSEIDVYRELKGDTVQCSKLNKVAAEKGERVSPKNSAYKVSAGRSYFYSAPNEQCKKRNIFIVKDELIDAYVNFKGFSSIRYFKKNGGVVCGWVHTDSITPTEKIVRLKP